MPSPDSQQSQQNLQSATDPQVQVEDLLNLHDSPLARALYIGAGFLALLLGLLGAILPVLPTTPFILLAAACFARGSEHFHRKLIENRVMGPIIIEWYRYRSIPYAVKRWVYLLMALSFGSSILIVPETWQQIMLIVIGSILTFYIWRIPVRNTPNF